MPAGRVITVMREGLEKTTRLCLQGFTVNGKRFKCFFLDSQTQ